MPSTVVVIPSIREKNLCEFLEAWEKQFEQHNIIVVEDNPSKTFDIKYNNVTHVSWTEIDKVLGENSWIIPRRTDCVRSFGYILAYAMSPEMIVTLDDDCFPISTNFIEDHWQSLQTGTLDGWVSTGSGAIPRGVPYFDRTRSVECVLNHGLWTNVPDFDAITQLTRTRTGVEWLPAHQTVPQGKFYPMCGMNLAWKPFITPALYFLLMGKDYKYDRFGDIWAGILSKHIIDHLGFAVNSGDPSVEHRRASNVWSNLVKEAPAMQANEVLWRLVANTTLTKNTVEGCYEELARSLSNVDDYWLIASNAMRVWLATLEQSRAVLAAVRNCE